MVINRNGGVSTQAVHGKYSSISVSLCEEMRGRIMHLAVTHRDQYKAEHIVLMS